MVVIKEIIVKLDNGNDLIIPVYGDYKTNVEKVCEQILENKDFIKIRLLDTISDLVHVRDIDFLRKLGKPFVLHKKFKIDLTIHNESTIVLRFNKYHMNYNRNHIFIRTNIAEFETMNIEDFINITCITCKKHQLKSGNFMWYNNKNLKLTKYSMESKITIETIKGYKDGYEY